MLYFKPRLSQLNYKYMRYSYRKDLMTGKNFLSAQPNFIRQGRGPLGVLWVGGFDPSTETGYAGPAVACCRPSDRLREDHQLLRVAETRKDIKPEAPLAFDPDSTKSANHGLDCAKPCLKL